MHLLRKWFSSATSNRVCSIRNRRESTRKLLLETLETRQVFAAPWAPIVDLDVDTNRDGRIDGVDEFGEDRWEQGAGGRGAVILPNADKDNDSNLAPDNWRGGRWGNVDVPANNTIDNLQDLADIGAIQIAQMGNIPSGSVVTLEVRKPGSEHEWFSRLNAEDRIRIFRPSQNTERGWAFGVSDRAVIGPGLGNRIRFVDSPVAANELPLNMLRGRGRVTLGVEGLEAGARVQIRLQAQAPNKAVYSDTVQLKVAPFVFTDHSSRPSDRPSSILVDPTDPATGDLAQVLKDTFGNRVKTIEANDAWVQDGFEIGYAQSPYGSMTVVIDLPRGSERSSEGGVNQSLRIRTELLGPGIGVISQIVDDPQVQADVARFAEEVQLAIEQAFQRLLATGQFPGIATLEQLIALYESGRLNAQQKTLLENERETFFDKGAGAVGASTNWYGGALETIPSRFGGPGTLMYGRSTPRSFERFLEAQDAQPRVKVNTEWLQVGHIDEVVSFGPTGKTVAIADPDLAWGLFLLANEANPDARMLQGMNENGPEGIRVGDVVSNRELRAFNRDVVNAPENLPSIVNLVSQKMGFRGPVSTPYGLGNRGTAQLAKAGAFTALFQPGEVRQYQVVFRDANQYNLRWRTQKTGWQTSKTIGDRNKDVVFSDAGAYLFTDFWRGGNARAGDRFAFKTNLNATAITIPVLFSAAGDFAGAYNMNHVNGLSVGNAFVTGAAYGPVVSINGGESDDLLDRVVKSAFRQVGYRRVVTADVRAGHGVSGGSVHCMTNIIRLTPETKWYNA